MENSQKKFFLKFSKNIYNNQPITDFFFYHCLFATAVQLNKKIQFWTHRFSGQNYNLSLSTWTKTNNIE